MLQQNVCGRVHGHIIKDMSRLRTDSLLPRRAHTAFRSHTGPMEWCFEAFKQPQWHSIYHVKDNLYTSMSLYPCTSRWNVYLKNLQNISKDVMIFVSSRSILYPPSAWSAEPVWFHQAPCLFKWKSPVLTWKIIYSRRTAYQDPKVVGSSTHNAAGSNIFQTLDHISQDRHDILIYSNLSRVASAQLKNMRCWVNIELISRWSMMIHRNPCFLSLWGPTNVKTTRQGRRSNSDNGLSWVVSCEPWLWDLRTGSDRLTSQNQGGPMFRFTLW